MVEKMYILFISKINTIIPTVFLFFINRHSMPLWSQPSKCFHSVVIGAACCVCHDQSRGDNYTFSIINVFST